MVIIYVLIFLLVLVSFFLISFLLRKEKLFDEEIKSLIDSRIDKVERLEKLDQQVLVELKIKEWKLENEFEIRRTAIKRANVSILDTISEEVSIVKENFSFNPKDVKFIGRFIDLIIFDGAADEEEVSIYLVNVIQENNPDMNINQYKPLVLEAIKNRTIHFKEVNL